MKIKKIIENFENSELEITGATLLSTDEARALPQHLRAYSKWWWLRSPCRYQHNAVCVNRGGSVDYIGDYVYYDNDVVRPALKIKNLKSSNLVIGDRFLFGEKRFEIVSEKLAFCLSDIGTHRFDSNCNDYKKSEVKKYVDKWFEGASKND